MTGHPSNFGGFILIFQSSEITPYFWDGQHPGSAGHVLDTKRIIATGGPSQLVGLRGNRYAMPQCTSIVYSHPGDGNFQNSSTNEMTWEYA